MGFSFQTKHKILCVYLTCELCNCYLARSKLSNMMEKVGT